MVYRPPFEPFPIPADEPMWVFAYGSLLWRPGFTYEAAYRGWLEGYGRHFCIASFHYRGTPDHPGLVLGLDDDPAGCEGLVYKVAPARQDGVMRYLWEREMVNGVYTPKVLQARLTHEPDAPRVPVCTFVADHDHQQYRGRLPLKTAAEMIATAAGEGGDNRTYLANTLAQLETMGIADDHLRALLERVDARRAAAGIDPA